MSVRILLGDVRETLKSLPDASVQCVVTSPPYWGLRDYGVDGQIGLEQTPDTYVAEMVGVFREVRRVMRKDATLWMNLGDSYNSVAGNYRGVTQGIKGEGGSTLTGGMQTLSDKSYRYNGRQSRVDGLKPKDLVGIPWRVAFALQADGWWLRQDLIWHKPNPMPESVTDRCTKSHEYVFLMTKADRYFYDADAIKEPSDYAGHIATSRADDDGRDDSEVRGGKRWTGEVPSHRNRRSVWTIPTQAFPQAHFATFPEALVEPCILAGTSVKGCCPACGAPWRRVVESEQVKRERPNEYVKRSPRDESGSNCINQLVAGVRNTTVGWGPTCKCESAEPIPCTVLDPFGGAGTVGLVAQNLGRDAILCELNPTYAEMAERRIHSSQPLFADVTCTPPP
jgi:DNA modification methylase